MPKRIDSSMRSKCNCRSRSEEHTSELQSRRDLVCRLLLATAHPLLHTLSLHDALPICPNHTGYGTPLSIMKSGAWQTPLGDLQIDESLCAALMKADPQLEDDAEAHRFEHALEVQLPFKIGRAHV